jgi:hypothetical protein
VETDVEALLADMAALGEEPTLLVACGFDGALSPDGDDRAIQQSSEALNVLLALPGTTVAVVSRRPPDEVAELMFLSGSKGGLWARGARRAAPHPRRGRTGHRRRPGLAGGARCG